ncbi:MAG: SDR family oxidoreductase [Dysgonamonadaceae bacterium]|jgi:short-subunit dehydrogenase|nr:SDR family oxidoreductase [Dysgonamonadaceae bacterium]
MTYTLITGASGGIGYELAKLFAKDKHNLILVARSAGKLQNVKIELETQNGISVVVIAKDLLTENAANELFTEIQTKNLNVDILVNNAGFGDYVDFLTSDLEKQKNMIQLNINALMQLSYFFGNEMKKCGTGRILNLASVAGIVAMPHFAVYAATKAFVLSFSQALDEELRGSGVSVTALCPGPVATGFENAANMRYSKLMMFGSYSAKQIAGAGYKALTKGKAVQYGGFMVGFVNIASRFLPRLVVRKLVKKVMKSTKI